VGSLFNGYIIASFYYLCYSRTMKYKQGDKVRLLKPLYFADDSSSKRGDIHTVHIGKPGDFLNETMAFVTIGRFNVIIQDMTGHKWAYTRGYFEKVEESYKPMTEVDYYKWLAARL